MAGKKLEKEFDDWKESTNGHEWIVWLGIDESKSVINLLLIVDDKKGGGGAHGDETEEAEELQLQYPADSQR